jgi:phosphate transport system substrate-binding protein
MVAAVAKDPNGICYAGLSSGKALKHLSIKADRNSAAVEPSLQNIKSANYPLSRQLHWFLAGRPAGPAKELCLWVLSQEAQGIAEGIGFIPISAETRAAVLARL